MTINFLNAVVNIPQLRMINTALGSIDTDIGSFASRMGQIGVGLGGVAAVGLIIAGSFAVLTSAGDPEKLMEGKDMITNALMGLALVVLALFVLQFLGWDLLGIDELGQGAVEFNQFDPP